MKKACFVFGNYIYNHLPNIILPGENESIGESIQRINSIELDNYLKFFYSTLNSVSVSKSKDILPVGREEFDFIINYIKNQEVI